MKTLLISVLTRGNANRMISCAKRLVDDIMYYRTGFNKGKYTYQKMMADLPHGTEAPGCICYSCRSIIHVE
jgi:hypothetical protein